MSMTEVKQKQIDEALKEALDLQKQIDEISRIAAEYSDKFNKIGENIKKSSKDFGKLTKTVLKGTKYKKIASNIGNLTELSLDILGELTGEIGGWLAKRKKKKKIEQMLPAKQKLAKEKISFIQNTIPKFPVYKAKASKICQTDAPLVLDYTDKSRYNLIKKGILKGFEAYFIFENLEKVCEFMLAEFTAWLNGDHESKMHRPKASISYANCVGQFIEWSELPTHLAGYQLVDQLTIGSILLLTDDEMQNASSLDSQVQKLSSNIASAKMKSSLFPFGTATKKFKSVYHSMLLKSSIINDEVRRKRNKIIKKIVWLSILAAVILYFIF